MKDFIGWLLVSVSFSLLLAMAYDLIAWIGYTLGLTRRRGIITRFRDWSWEKMFPDHPLKDDFGKCRFWEDGN